MKTKKHFAAALIALVVHFAIVAAASEPRQEAVSPQFAHAIPNIAGKSLTSVVVSFASVKFRVGNIASVEYLLRRCDDGQAV